MGDEDIIQIRIGSFQVGIIGLKEVMADLASSMAGASDEEVERRIDPTAFPKKLYSRKGQGRVRTGMF